MQNSINKFQFIEFCMYDMEQGMAQDLIGMDIASDHELDEVDTSVYGIVTNYVQWIFLKSLNDKIEKNFDVSHFDKYEIITFESLKIIAGKIYALLSDD